MSYRFREHTFMLCGCETHVLSGARAYFSCSVDVRRTSYRFREHTFMLCRVRDACSVGCETHALSGARAYFHALWMRESQYLCTVLSGARAYFHALWMRDACPVGCESILSCSVDARRNTSVLSCWLREHTFMLCGCERRNTSVLSCRVREHTFMLCGCEAQYLCTVLSGARAYFHALWMRDACPVGFESILFMTIPLYAFEKAISNICSM
jgi:hypothetical protein